MMLNVCAQRHYASGQYLALSMVCLWCSIKLNGRGGIVVRAHASLAEGLWFESDSIH